MYNFSSPLEGNIFHIYIKEQKEKEVLETCLTLGDENINKVIEEAI